MRHLIDKNKYSSSELALLGVFTLGLLMSFMLVSFRKRITLTEPIELPFGSVSVSIPQGNGWQGYTSWNYSQFHTNMYVLRSEFQSQNSKVIVHWQYKLATGQTDFDEAVKQFGIETGTKSSAQGKIKTGDYSLLWAFMSDSNMAEGLYYAWAKLPGGRTVDLIVSAAADPELAERVFKAVAASLSVTDDSRQIDGIKFVRQLKNRGVANLLKRETDNSFDRMYLIRKRGGNDVGEAEDAYSGFVAERFGFSGNFSGAGINAESLFLISREKGRKGESSFKCDDNLNSFHWQNDQSTEGRPMLASIEIAYSDGQMKWFNLNLSDYVSQKNNVFYPNESAWPEILLDSFAAQFLDSNSSELIIDIIVSNGRIVPAKVSMIDRQDASETFDGAEYVVKFTLFDRSVNFQEVYFDRNKSIIGRVEKSTETFVLERTDLRQLYMHFDEWQSHIEGLLKF